MCDPGIACRDKIMTKVRQDTRDLWIEAVEKIQMMISNTNTRVGWTIDMALIDMEACKGCKGLFTCPRDANERHHKMHANQAAPTARMVELLAEYDSLLAQQAEIFITCP